MSAPTPDSNGYLTLQADDASWHRVWLIQDEGIRLDVEQDPVADPLTRGYIIITAADVTKHRVDLFLDEGVYRLNVEQDVSVEDSDYTTLLLGLNPTDGFRYAVTVIADEGYRLAVDDTPIPVEEDEQAGFGGYVLFPIPRRKPRRKVVDVSVAFAAPVVRVESARFATITETNAAIAADGNPPILLSPRFSVSAGVTVYVQHSTFSVSDPAFGALTIHNPSEEELAMWLVD